MRRKFALRKMWDQFVESFQEDINAQTKEVDRAIGFARLREQVWDALENSEQTANAWAWPLDIFVDGDTGALFTIVAQSGKLFEIPFTITNETVSLGAWTQVTEVFTPVQQSKVTISRQKDGRHRWLFVAATSVLNRVGEIDSTKLFDSFIQHIEQDKEHVPVRVDFYHLGKYNPEAWEFGTADFHAREGYCYIMSGLFDEDHPLAKATIRAFQDDPEKWGCSIEFFATVDAQVVVVEPEIRVPVYTEGKIIRVSVVKEEDAAGLFTRIANITEEKIRMKKDVMAQLTELFGNEDAATKFLENFGEDVDRTNRSVDEERLVHRAKAVLKDAKAKVDDPDEDEDEEDEEDTDTEDTEESDEEIVLDDELVDQVAQRLASTPQMKAILQSIEKLTTKVDELTTARAKDAKMFAALEKEKTKLAQRLAAVEEEDTKERQTALEDLPSRRIRRYGYRPRDAHGSVDEEGEEDMEVTAERTLEGIPQRKLYGQ